MDHSGSSSDRASRAFSLDPDAATAQTVNTGGDIIQIIYSPAGTNPPPTDERTFVVGSPPDREEGRMVSAPVELVSTGDVGGFTLVLNYNPDHLSVANVDFDSALRDAFVQWNVPQLGQLRIVVGTEGDAIPAGTQTVATVNFRARTVVADSTSQLRLQVVDVSSPTGDILANTGVRNGEVTVLTTGSTDNNANDRLDVGDATLLMRLLAAMDTQRTWDLDRNDRNLNHLLDSGDVIKLLRLINELDPPPAEAPLLAASGMSESPAGELAFLTPSRSQATAGQLLRVQVRLENLQSTISGAAFTLSYPVNALRLAASQPHRTGTMVSGNSLASWNATTPGQLRLAVSSDSAWLTTEGVLAEITFEVLSGAADQHIWPLALGAVEVTPDGYAPRTVATQGAEFIGRPALAGTLSAPRYGKSGEFIFSLTGDPGATYSIQASTDLVNWDTLTSALNATGTIEFTDPDAASFSRRFYRVVPAE
jgi:hypothetical protein